MRTTIILQRVQALASSNPHNQLMEGLLLSPLYRWEH